MVRSHSGKEFGKRSAVATTLIVAVVVIVIAIIGVGAYIAVSGGKTTTTSSTSTSSVSTTASTTTTSTTTSTVPENLQGAGSTLVNPLMSAWTFAYGQLTGGIINVNYNSVGSGAGIAQITARTVDFGASDAPMTAAQYANIKNGTILTIPESASAVVPAYNLPGISNGLHFTGNVLALIFLGNITMWNDPAIQALNTNVTLPAHAITVVHRSDASGTMFAFTNYLSDSNTVWKTKVGTGTAPNWPTGIGCKGNEGVAGCISNTPYAIGPLEIAYEIINKGLISYGAVENAAGNFVLANLTNTAAAVAAGASGLPAGNTQWTNVSIINNIFNDSKDTTIYPITTFTYLLVYMAQTSQPRGEALVNFLWWVVNSAQQGGTNLGYVPMPSNVVTIDDTTINSITYNGVALHTGM
jgi:phosphate transport system substrate-binding protein